MSRLPMMLSPSLLSADFVNLERDVRMLERAGADFLHVDVMDGHFVPNITIGPIVVKAIRSVTALPLDCHLMIEHPDQFIPDFAKAGADVITVHVEAVTHLDRTINFIKSFGVKAGVSLNPSTPLSSIEEVLSQVDLVLLMSVNPGFGGQKFIPSLFRRAQELRKLIDREKLNVLIEADGGIKLENVKEVYEAGVDVIVSGSGIFGSKNPTETMQQMKVACAGSLNVLT